LVLSANSCLQFSSVRIHSLTYVRLQSERIKIHLIKETCDV